MSLIRYEPFDVLNRPGVLGDCRSLFGPFFTGVEADDQSDAFVGNWKPAVDIKEEEDRFVILADLPGVNPADIEVTTENGVLALKGERKSETEENREGYKKAERVRGAFYRRFSLPEGVASDKIAATGKDGVLEISIPKQEKAQPKRIAVTG